MKNYLNEFIGTFFLVFTIGLAVTSGTPLAPVAIGGVLMVMVYMGGHVSGGHYNPAVTLAATMRGALAGGQALPYMLSQVLGAICASLLVWRVASSTFAPAPTDGADLLNVLLLELLFTFALCLVVLNSAVSKKTQGNSFYGLAIGSTVMVGAATAGPISGGAFNPAVGLGPILVDTMAGGSSISSLWIYLVAPLAGGALAAWVFGIQED